MKKQFTLKESVIVLFIALNPFWVNNTNAQTAWKEMNPMNVAKGASGSCAIDSMIYVFGGFDKVSQTLATADVYNTKTNEWSGLSPIPVDLAYTVAGVINDTIYVTSGYRNLGGDWISTDSMYLYDPVADNWETRKKCPIGVAGPASCVLNDGFYLFGGRTGYDRSGRKDALVYDPATDTWDSLPEMKYGRIGATASVHEGQIYIFGGIDTIIENNYRKTKKTEKYDPGENSWTELAEMPVPASGHLSLVFDGKIYLFGGDSLRTSEYSRAVNLIQEYNPLTDQWQIMEPMPFNRSLFTGQRVVDSAYIIGGYPVNALIGTSLLSEVWRFNLDSLKIWEPDCNEVDVNVFSPRPFQAVDSSAMFSAKVLPVYLPDRSVSWTTSNEEIATVTSDGMVTGVSPGEVMITATSNSGGCSASYELTVFESVPEVIIQVIDSNTMEILSDCKIFLNGEQFVKESEDPLDLTGWAYDTCLIKVTKSNYFDLDTAVIVKSDTSLVINLKYAYQPDLFVYSKPLLEKTDYLEMMMTQHGLIYLTPESTPAVVDSITNYEIKSYSATAGKKLKKSMQFIPPGIYRTFGLSNAGRIAADSYVVQVIDHFPACIIQVKDAVSKELIDSCLLVVKCPLIFDGQDTISGPQGEFDLTGYYDTCSITVSREGYYEFDTTLVVLTDISHVIYLVPMNTGAKEAVFQEIRIYPNPTQALFTIQTKEQGFYTLEIISLSGQVMKKMEFSESLVQVDLSSYQSNVYLIRIILRDEVYMGRVVKY